MEEIINKIFKEKYPRGLSTEYTKEEMAGYMMAISDIKQQLTLTDVNQQRELLIAFSECVVKDVTRKGHEEVVDYFLKKHKGINCG